MIKPPILIAIIISLCAGCGDFQRTTVQELLSNSDKHLDKEIRISGIVDRSIQIPLTPLKLFRLYDDGHAIWVATPESMVPPPECMQVQVWGVLSRKDFPAIKTVYYVLAKQIKANWHPF